MKPIILEKLGNAINHARSPRRSFLILLVIACFAFLPQMQAQLPPEIPANPDGCYPAFTTAEGCNALFLLGGGIGNTAVGWYSLFLAGDASFNTGVGAGALALATTGANDNTAVGTAAMLLNTAGSDNVAVGTNALLFNDSGNFNNAVGSFALFNNFDGSSNKAVGHRALELNTTGDSNNAFGDLALKENLDGFGTTAVGDQALAGNLLLRYRCLQLLNFEIEHSLGLGALGNGSGLGWLRRKSSRVRPSDDERAHPSIGKSRPQLAQVAIAAATSFANVSRTTFSIVSLRICATRQLQSLNQKMISKSLMPFHFPGWSGSNDVFSTQIP